MTYFGQEDYIDENFEHARDHLEGLLEDIYTTGSISDLEFHLDEVCKYFDLTIPRTDPVVEKKPTELQKQTARMLQTWVGQTRAYAEMMCRQTTRKEK